MFGITPTPTTSADSAKLIDPPLGLKDPEILTV